MALSSNQPVNRHDAWAAGLSLFALMAGHSLLETARDALFLSRSPASQLPWTYLAIAAITLGVVRANRSLTGSWDKRRLLAATMAVLGAGTVCFWALFGLRGNFVPHAFYVWTGVVASVATVQFWLLLGEVFTVTEAKRLYSAIAAGGVLGAVVGSGLSELLLHFTDARPLLLCGAGFLVVAGVLPRMCGNAEEEVCRGPRCAHTEASNADNRSHAYSRRLFGIALLSTLTLTIVDFLFKSEVARLIPAGELGCFFARFYLVSNIAALAVQLVLSPRLLRGLGASRSLLVLPVLLGFGVVGMAVTAGLVPVLLLKAADGAFRHSVHRSAMEVLFLPLSQSLRAHCKGIIDAIGQRGGQAIASLAILAATFAGAEPIHLACAVGALSLLWVLSVRGLKGVYLELFRSHLRRGSIETRIDVPELDLHSLESLLSALNSEHDEEVLATLDLIGDYGKHNVIPVLILYHPSSAVVIRALHLLVTSGRKDYGPVAKRLLEHDDLEVRAAAMRALAMVLPEAELRSVAQERKGPLIRAAAAVGLISRGVAGVDELAELEECLGGTTEERIAVTRAIRCQEDRQFAPLLLRLAQNAVPELEREVAVAMGALRSPEFAKTLIDMIAHRPARAEARNALANIGTAALEPLSEALTSAKTRRKTRIHLPHAIARIYHPKSVEVLVQALEQETDGLIRFKLIRALERLSALVNDAKVDREVLRRMITEAIERAIQMLDWTEVTRRAQAADEALSTAGGELLLAVLLEKQSNAIDRAIRLTSLLRPSEDYRLIHIGLRSKSKKLRAESVELLEAVADPSISSGLIALVEDASDEERLRRASDATGYRPAQADYAGLLRTMLSDASEAVRCVSAYHVGELGLTELHARLREARPEASPFLSAIIDRALATLSLPPVTGAQHAT
ncbi:MAG: hypothetical protein MUF54_06845 [Polyangiaceae bacterium]|jgi:hypothetical protein|nr:hypothetical protein [Polyangiaceae bacterium]